jgi:UDP-N-acetylenolpyruvoylglucosamine reductase
LIEDVRDAVLQQGGVRLETEVKVWRASSDRSVSGTDPR